MSPKCGSERRRQNNADQFTREHPRRNQFRKPIWFDPEDIETLPPQPRFNRNSGSEPVQCAAQFVNPNGVNRIVGIQHLSQRGELRRDPAHVTPSHRVRQRERLHALQLGLASELSVPYGGSGPAYREWERNVSRWLYSADHITLSYTLMYDRLSIERLSPGLRGIVLLLLYLAVDRSESDPLIIDQPEENLDPESIYTELVQLFRDASRRRQIVMVTHNANLVVNTDVDQVIAAHCDSFEEGKLPQLRYLAGGLEDPEVRRTVCEVLEGGAEAFRQRARRLRLSM